MKTDNTAIKVLLFNTEYHPRFSGHGVYLRRLVPSLVRRGIDITIVTCDFGHLPRIENVDGTAVHRIPVRTTSRDWNFSQQWSLLKYLHRHRKQFDILHYSGHVDVYGLITCWCRVFRKKIIMQMVLLEADDPRTISRSYKFGALRLRILRMTDRFICISKALIDRCLEKQFPMKKLRLVYQGVDLEYFKPVAITERQSIRSSLSIDLDVPLVAFVGAIILRKGIDRLISAWRIVQAEIPYSQLLLIGPDSFEAGASSNELNQFVGRLKSQVSREELNVEFLGTSSKVAKYMQISDVFVLPSRNEGFGNVIIEAMACALPVVATDLGGVANETIVDGETGYIVDSIETLADRLIFLLENPIVSQKMGSLGRQRAETKFRFSNISDEYANIYRELARKN